MGAWPADSNEPGPLIKAGHEIVNRQTHKTNFGDLYFAAILAGSNRGTRGALNSSKLSRVSVPASLLQKCNAKRL